MNEFERKRQKALSLVAATGIRKPNYLPPTFPILWRIGVEIPPPHFMSFMSLLVLMGLPFGLCWIGLYMLSHPAENIDWTAGVIQCLLAVLLPGLLFAVYYRAGRRRFHLPRWSEL